MNVEIVVDCKCETGEKPLWHPDEERLYWIDIPKGRLYRYNPTNGEHELCYQSSIAIGGYTIQEDGSLLLFQDCGVVNIWRNGIVDPLIEGSSEAGGLFNDVIADPAGRVFCGMKADSKHSGRLFRLDTNKKLNKILDDIGQPNGMGFSLDCKSFYFTDTFAGVIYIFDYDIISGLINNQREFIRVPSEDGKPDGMKVDADGYIWSAHYDGGCIVRYANDGTEATRISFPVKKTTCLTFGGHNYNDIYVTTAEGDEQLSGSLFRVHNGFQGKQEFRSKIF